MNTSSYTRSIRRCTQRYCWQVGASIALGRVCLNTRLDRCDLSPLASAGLIACWYLHWQSPNISATSPSRTTKLWTATASAVPLRSAPPSPPGPGRGRKAKRLADPTLTTAVLRPHSTSWSGSMW